MRYDWFHKKCHTFPGIETIRPKRTDEKVKLSIFECHKANSYNQLLMKVKPRVYCRCWYFVAITHSQTQTHSFFVGLACLSAHKMLLTFCYSRNTSNSMCIHSQSICTCRIWKGNVERINRRKGIYVCRLWAVEQLNVLHRQVHTLKFKRDFLSNHPFAPLSFSRSMWWFFRTSSLPFVHWVSAWYLMGIL